MEVRKSQTKLSERQLAVVDKQLAKAEKLFNIIHGYIEQAQETTIESIRDTTSRRNSDAEITEAKYLMIATKGAYLNGVAPAIRDLTDFAIEAQTSMSKAPFFTRGENKQALAEHSKMYANLTVGLVLKSMLENADELLEIINS